MNWKGTYGTTLTKGGGTIVDDSSVISMYGDVSKMYELDSHYPVTGNTHFHFSFELLNEAEGHIICLEENENPDTYAGFHKRCIGVGGTQFDEWSDHLIKKVDEKVTKAQLETFSIKVGNFFEDIETKIKYIAFVQVNNAAPYKGSSKFSNFKLKEEAAVSLSCFRLFYKRSSFNNISITCTEPNMGGVIKEKLEKRARS